VRLGVAAEGAGQLPRRDGPVGDAVGPHRPSLPRRRPADEVEDGRTAAGRIAELETSLKEVELLKSLGAM
jgi:hypothetical protein